jgi:tRNA nucleotidyltransferase (CCA-adding enzyme)
LARRLAPATIDQLCTVMRADHLGRPPLIAADSSTRIDELQSAARALELQKEAPRPLMLGRHLISLGLKPGSTFKPILDEAFEAQLDGVFGNENEGLEWLKKRLQAGTRDLA